MVERIAEKTKITTWYKVAPLKDIEDLFEKGSREMAEGRGHDRLLRERKGDVVLRGAQL